MFVLNYNTAIEADDKKWMTVPVKNAVNILERDREKAFRQTGERGGKILLKQVRGMAEEAYVLTVEAEQIKLEAGDDLGFIYGLLYLSETYMGIKPFWFWMDQQIEKRERVEIEEQVYHPVKPVVRFRGWFFNDEVLMLKWKYNENSDAGWRMCFETLLRCGGNMTIPGTDKMSRRNRQLASDMGLWITHHHAEPLGAEMFVRAFPDVEPNYLEQRELFQQLWREAVEEQKDYKVVWNLCFRGQGDAPFWNYDTTGQFDTPEKRGRMISEVIKTQADIVREYIEHPVFCTNLYGEIMELYEQGHVKLDEDLIKVRADNGFGRMVTRRQGNHNPRVNAMPDKNEKGAQGIYYHVSFYDLQAANHITMLPNSVEFVDKELAQVLENGGDDFWVINCSNVRPHAYYLDAVRKKWFGREIDDRIQSEEFAADYYGGSVQIADCYRTYHEAMLSFGEHEDEHMGEQYYTENLRIIANRMITAPKEPAAALRWVAGEHPLQEQTAIVCGVCGDGLSGLEAYYQKCAGVDNRMESALFHNTLFLQAKIHYFCAKGVALFGEAYEAFLQERYENAFVLFGRSAECFDYVNEEMRGAEYGIWKDFYLNDCFADVKHTAYMVRKARSLVRETAEGSRHDKWYHKYCYTKEDQGIYLLLVTDNHMTDEEIYQVMKDRVDENAECSYAEIG